MKLPEMHTSYNDINCGGSVGGSSTLRGTEGGRNIGLTHVHFKSGIKKDEMTIAIGHCL